MATLMASRKVASIMVLLDEIDKAQDNHRESGGIQAYLLGLLEPETVCRHSDVYLKTECDFSGVLWLATANRLSTISGPLMSRLRVLQMGQPRKEHFAVIAENVIEGLAKRWGLDRWVLPEVSELDLPLGQLSSARQVRVATEAAAASWARALQRH
jgi:ATP-dependent Lon protease